MIQFVLDENIVRGTLNLNDFDFIKEYSQQNRFNILRDELKMKKEIHLKLFNSSIRRVEHYIFELETILKKEEYQKNKETVISFFFIKHFLQDVYNKLNIENGLLETLKFRCGSKSYTIIELIALYRLGKIDAVQINDMFNDEENILHYCLLRLFNYNCNQVVKESDSNKRYQQIMNEPIQILKNKISNEKKDRLIWNLLENGKSKYTDYEYVGKKFINDVLNKPQDEQVSCCGEFWKSSFHNDSRELDNKTIFRIGIPSFIELFKSFRLLGVSYKERIGLIDIYFDIENIEEISSKLIQNINYCALDTNEEYIHILNKINKLNVIENLNSEKSFSYFLGKYIGVLSNLGYIATLGYYNINAQMTSKEKENFVIQDLNKVITDINDMKINIQNKLVINRLEEDLDTIINFANKMIEVIKYENSIDNKKSDLFKNMVTSTVIYPEEYERIRELLNNKSANIKEEVEKSFLAGKITPSEVDELLKMWH